MKCHAYRIFIDGLETGELNDEEAGLLCRHLEICAGCRAYQEGRRASFENGRVDGQRVGVMTCPPGAAPGSNGGSWGWAAAIVVVLAAVIALMVVFGHGRWMQCDAPRHGGTGAGYAVGRRP